MNTLAGWPGILVPHPPSQAIPLVVSIIITVTVVPTLSGATDPEANPPTHCIYHDQVVELELDRGRIGVLFADNVTSVQREAALAAASLDAGSLTPTGVDAWHLATLKSDLTDAVDTDSRIRALTESPAIEFASPVFRGSEGGWVIVTPHIHARVRPGHAAAVNASLDNLAPEIEVVARDFHGLPGVLRLRSKSRNGFEVLARANALARDPALIWAEPEMQASDRAHAIPDDPGFSNLWGVLNSGQFGGTPGMDMDGELAWDTCEGDGVMVLIMDRGIQLDHPDLADNIAIGRDFTSEAGDGGPVNECDNHGTMVAGCVVAVADNAVGTCGIAPRTTLFSARVSISNVPCDGIGTYQHSWIVAALTEGQSAGARVSVNSRGLAPSQLVEDAFNATHENGMVHFQSAGNSGDTDISWPGTLPTVNAVSSIDPVGGLSPFSNFGPEISVSAPGRFVYTTDRTGPDGDDPGDYIFTGGTSFATPYAAGVAALILSYEPSLSADEVEAKVQCSARDLGDAGFDEFFGHGLVNARRAVLSPVGVDGDSDGTDDACDNCPSLENTDQGDGDHDGIGDVCDPCPEDWYDDIDQDGHCGNVDNCPFDWNPGQADAGDDVCVCGGARFVFTGEGADDYLGWRAGGAGDVNNDGFGDIIVGAPKNDGAGANVGGAWVYSGTDGSLLYTLTGEALDDRFGRSVAGLGDINEDGFGEVAVSAFFNDAGGSAAGRVYVFLGGPGPFPMSVSARHAYYDVTGEAANDQFGNEITTTDDVDGDGIRELFVGAYLNNSGGYDSGAAYLFSGEGGQSIHTWIGEAAGDYFGWDVADAGDTNSDGVTDVIVGAPGSDDGGSDAGAAIVFSGLDGSLLYRFTGETPGDAFGGGGASGGGDLNGDTYADVIVGAPAADAGGVGGGRAYVFFGGPGPYPVERSAADADMILTGEEWGEDYGRSVSGIGDVDGNGLPDVVVGASLRGVAGRGRAGRAYVHSGQTGELLHTVAGESDGDGFGVCVDGNWDLDHDGANDLIVGAYTNDQGGLDAGRAYVYLLGDQDGDGLSAGCDNCPQGSNSDQQATAFDREIIAVDAQTFQWEDPLDVAWVRGALDEVNTYVTDLQGTLTAAEQLIDANVPGPGLGYYYVFKLGVTCEVGSWQTFVGAEPERDTMLP